MVVCDCTYTHRVCCYLLCLVGCECSNSVSAPHHITLTTSHLPDHTYYMHCGVKAEQVELNHTLFGLTENYIQPVYGYRVKYELLYLCGNVVKYSLYTVYFSHLPLYKEWWLLIF